MGSNGFNPPPSVRTGEFPVDGRGLYEVVFQSAPVGEDGGIPPVPSSTSGPSVFQSAPVGEDGGIRASTR